MPLRAIEIAGFRAIERGRMTFADDTTFVFGENDSGRSGLLEAIRLILGRREVVLEDELRPHHFRSAQSARRSTIRIRVEVGESEPGKWQLPAHVAESFPGAGDKPRVLLFDFRASLAPDGSVSARRWIQSRDSRSLMIETDTESERWLRASFPVMWLGPGTMTSLPEPGLLATAEDSSTEGLASDPDVRALFTHQRNLISGTTSDVALDIERGAAAAAALIERYPRVFAGTASLISAMAAEILDRQPPTGGPANGTRGLATNPAGQIALVLLATAIIDLAEDALRSGPLPVQAEPVMILENPEANLHPTTIASLWRFVERISWQKIVATHSDVVLTYAPVTAMRRLTRQVGRLHTWSVRPRSLSRDALRKIDYHLRSRRASAVFARCWVLVEGETEFWVVPELARVLGHDLAAEGVACVEFAQSGPEPLLKAAAQLGIGCVVMTDGDHAGLGYSAVAARFAPGVAPALVAVSTLAEPDIEHCFWNHGFADVIERVANLAPGAERTSPTAVIHHAIDRTSKPYLALALVEAAVERGPGSVPPPLRNAIDSAVRIARSGATTKD